MPSTPLRLCLPCGISATHPHRSSIPPLPGILRWAGVSLGHYLGIKYLKPAPTPPDHGLASLLLRESTLAGKRPRWLRVGHRPEHGLRAGVSIPPRENTLG